jgi:hypothetical protein
LSGAVGFSFLRPRHDNKPKRNLNFTLNHNHILFSITYNTITTDKHP